MNAKPYSFGMLAMHMDGKLWSHGALGYVNGCEAYTRGKHK